MLRFNLAEIKNNDGPILPNVTLKTEILYQASFDAALFTCVRIHFHDMSLDSSCACLPIRPHDVNLESPMVFM